MRYCIGIDLGGTNIAGGIADLDGKLLLTDSIKTGLPCPASDIADRIALLCRRMATALGLALSDAAWVGIGAPGSVDVDTGTVLYANNLEFDNVPLGQMIHERTGLPVYVDNDANVAAWGEYCAGAGKGSSSMVMVTLGTGVGGGVVLNGKLLTGCNGAAAELGHFVIDMHGKECNCGMRGCFEQYGSVTALICQAREAMAAHKESKLWALAENEEANVNGKVILAAYDAGDETAVQVVNTYVHYLCVGVTSIINIFQPEVLCLGGGISRRSDVLVEPIRAFNADTRLCAAAAPSSPASCRPSCSAMRASSARPCWAKANKESGPMRKHYERILHDSESRVQRYLDIQILDENSPFCRRFPQGGQPGRAENGHLPRHDNDGLLPEPREPLLSGRRAGPPSGAGAGFCAPLSAARRLTLTSSTATSSPARTRLSAPSGCCPPMSTCARSWTAHCPPRPKPRPLPQS